MPDITTILLEEKLSANSIIPDIYCKTNEVTFTANQFFTIALYVPSNKRIMSEMHLRQMTSFRSTEANINVWLIRYDEKVMSVVLRLKFG